MRRERVSFKDVWDDAMRRLAEGYFLGLEEGQKGEMQQVGRFDGWFVRRSYVEGFADGLFIRESASST